MENVSSGKFKLNLLKPVCFQMTYANLKKKKVLFIGFVVQVMVWPRQCAEGDSSEDAELPHIFNHLLGHVI